MTPLPFMGVTVSRVGLEDSKATNTNGTLASQNSVMNQYIRTYTFVSLKHSDTQVMATERIITTLTVYSRSYTYICIYKYVFVYI